MLTQEQIKNLNPGDKLCCTCSFVETEDYGNRIVVDMCYAGSKERTTSRISYFYEQLSLPPTQPKHDPCRMFKKGDEVTPKEVNGRHPGIRGAIFRVCQDEAESGREIKLAMDGHIGHITIDAAYLELVTPVEELEPYRIGKSDYNGFVNIEKKGKIIAMIPYGKELHEHKTEEEALAAAEAERDRLNAEWRKEQNNDA